MSDTLHLKYRPKTWDEVLGQGTAVKSISKLIEDNRSHAFLLSGPSGVGKTTIARIAALEVGCDAINIMEVPAAVHTGVDDVRGILESLQYKAFGKSSRKAVILDECHSLSKNAWQALLKAIEEPASHVYWFLATTEPEKVPKTVKTRCSTFTLKPVDDKQLLKLINQVIKLEKFKVSDGIVDLIVKQAGGSPRQALVNLGLCYHVTDRKEAADLLKAASDNDAVIELCRFLMIGGSWIKAMHIVERLEDENPESVRIVVSNYFASVAKNSKKDDSACHALSILQAFAGPYNQSENMAPLLSSIGQVLFAE